ncbi:MAG: type I-E CRISPR-associated protein Cas7/Cse4/CasC [Geobacteraceae bacterium]|nr:type I-E CRISPR-associated protein Cas7/Cse4/CasC [Geobacteraceae bacterium]
MSTFIQLHLLTSYPPSNLNRDDLGRPKTAVMGGKTRLRVSSQSLKRAWRESDLFKSVTLDDGSKIGDYMGKRTKRVGYEAAKKFKDIGVPQKDAVAWGKQIAEAFAETEAKDKKDPFKETILKQPIHLSHIEFKKLNDLISTLCREKRPPTDEELEFLSKEHNAVDIAMFGRMLAVKGKIDLGLEGAVQVSHAITVHEVAVEDDYFTAVDDLNDGPDAAHIGETEFGSGVFYLYLCVNRDLLKENLEKKDPELAGNLTNKALQALVEAAAKVSPTGKQNSFASRARTSYLLAEKGSDQPRSLSVAFLKPVRGEDVLALSVKELEKRRENFDKVYGPCADAFKIMNAETGEGSLEEIKTFITE